MERIVPIALSSEPQRLQRAPPTTQKSNVVSAPHLVSLPTSWEVSLSWCKWFGIREVIGRGLAGKGAPNRPVLASSSHLVTSNRSLWSYTVRPKGIPPPNPHRL